MTFNIKVDSLLGIWLYCNKELTTREELDSVLTVPVRISESGKPVMFRNSAEHLQSPTLTNLAPGVPRLQRQLRRNQAAVFGVGGQGEGFQRHRPQQGFVRVSPEYH